MEGRIIMDGRNPYGSRGGYVSNRRPRRRRGDRGMDYRGDMRRNGNRDMGDYRYDMNMRGYDRANQNYQDMRMDGHYPMHGQEQGSTYYPIQAMGTFEGYYGMPEQSDYGRGRDYNYDYGYDMRGNRGSRGRGRDYGDYGDYDDYGYNDYGDYGETLSEKELEMWNKKLLGQLDEREKQMFSKDAIMQKAKSIGKQMEGFGEKELYTTALMIYTDYKQSIGTNLDLVVKLAYDWLSDKDVSVKGAEKLAVYYDCIVEGENE